MNYEKQDSYVNTFTSLGNKNRDKTTATEIDPQSVFDKTILSNIYLSEGLGTKIVDCVADDATKKGWTYLQDEEEKIEQELDRLMFSFRVSEAWKFSRLYGGAIIVMITERGKVDKPLLPTNGPIRQFRVYSLARIDMTSADIVQDENSKYFEDVEYFKIRKRDGTFLNVHRSRCIVLTGELIPDYDINNLPIENQYFGLSVFQRVWQRLSYYGATEQAIANLMQEVVIGKYTLSNLSKILSMNNKEAVDKVLTRLEVMNTAKSVINGVVLGADEKYERDNLNLGGVGEVIDRQQNNLSSVCDIPVTRLFGRSPAGMNSTGESDERAYYDKVHRDQERYRYELNRAIQYVGLYVYGTSDPSVYGIDEFLSLREMTEKEDADIGKVNAETDNIYLMNGVLGADEVRQQRFPELEQDITFTPDLPEDDEL